MAAEVGVGPRAARGGQGDRVSVTLEEEDDLVHGLDANGRPDPEYPRALGILPASAGLRSLAFAIDAGIVLLLTLPLSLGTLPLWFSVILPDPMSDPLSAPMLDPMALIRDERFIAGLIFYLIGQGVLSVFVLVQLILHGLRGVTVGKAIVGIRSVNVARFTKPGFWRIALRGMVFWASLAIVPILGAIPFLLSPLWDREKRGRGWLDAIGGNWLIDVRRGLDPFDQKALRHARKRMTATEAPPEAQMPSLATGAGGVVPSFVPAGRSRSGVITARSFDADRSESWQPPPVGTREAPQPQQAAPSVPSPAGAGSARAVIQFDDGMRVDVTGTGLIGRGPAAQDGESIDHFVSVADESLLISKTHAAFGVDDGGFWLVDRGSVNGTSVLPPGGASHGLVPWERQHIAWNSVVEVGGRSFTVTAGPHRNGRDA